MKEKDMISGRHSFLLQNTKFAAIVGMAMIIIALTVSQTGMNEILRTAKMFSGVGNNAFLLATNGVLFFLAYKKGRKSIFYLTLKVDAAVLVVVHTLKNIPFGEWAHRPSGSPNGFPSGHTTHAFAMAFLMSVFYPRLAWLWYGMAAAISWSRIETNAHTGFQVTSGVIFGIGIAWFLVDRWLTHPDSAMLEMDDSEEQVCSTK